MAKQAYAANLWYRLVLQFSVFVLVVLVLEPNPVVSNTFHATPGLQNLAKDISLSKRRIRRKVGDLDVTSGAIEYMKELREKMESPNGEHDPTNILCILDKDLVNNVYRPKLPSQRCTAVNHYIYSLRSILEGEAVHKFPFHKSIIRAHLQVIPRLVKPYPIRVNITITAKLQHQDNNQYVFAGQDEINVTAESSGWVELNVTEGVNKLWPLVANSTSKNFNIEFIVQLQVDCTKTKKVPANFIEPTNIRLTQTKRRQRHTPLQALLLVYVREKEEMEIEKETNSMADTQEESRIRMSRSVGSSTPVCQKEDFSITFSDLGLNSILVPVSYNAYRCSGSCSHEVLLTNSHLGTNHAKIMASAKRATANNVIFQKQPRDPCCSPTEYNSLVLVLENGTDGYEILAFPSMIVSECGCR